MAANGIEFWLSDGADAIVDRLPPLPDPDDDPLNSARGLVTGSALGAALWACLLLGLWYVVA